ncbi:Hypothetical predicted protein, partial [Olea europaea subsp. europaea]
MVVEMFGGWFWFDDGGCFCWNLLQVWRKVWRPWWQSQTGITVVVAVLNGYNDNGKVLIRRHCSGDAVKTGTDFDVRLAPLQEYMGHLQETKNIFSRHHYCVGMCRCDGVGGGIATSALLASLCDVDIGGVGE